MNNGWQAVWALGVRSIKLSSGRILVTPCSVVMAISYSYSELKPVRYVTSKRRIQVILTRFGLNETFPIKGKVKVI